MLMQTTTTTTATTTLPMTETAAAKIYICTIWMLLLLFSFLFFLGEIICYLCTSYSSLVNLFYVPECDKRFFVSAQYFCHKWRVPRSENVYNYAIIFLIEKNRLMKQEVVISTAYYAGGNFVHAKIVIAWCLMFEHKKKNQSRNNNENHPSNRSDFRFCQEEI